MLQLSFEGAAGLQHLYWMIWFSSSQKDELYLLSIHGLHNLQILLGHDLSIILQHNEQKLSAILMQFGYDGPEQL